MTMSWNGDRDEIVAAVRDRDAESVLVRGRVAFEPTADAPAVTVGPGASATFDGSRWHRSFVVTVSTDRHRRRYRFGLAAVNDTVERVMAAAREYAVDAVWLHSRARLADTWSDVAVEEFERRLTAAAHAVDAALITTTGRSADPSVDETEYDVVFD